MRGYRLTITLQEPLFWATREIGRLYLSEPYLHNYALTYALGFARSTYHDEVQVPHYSDHLQPLNERGVYVTPAKPIHAEYTSNTFKLANKHYHVEMKKISKNVPIYGKARELAPETQYVGYVLAEKEVSLPAWIRLGKWMSKARIDVDECELIRGSGNYVVRHPLNPLDLADMPALYDLINMPPVSLIENAHMMGEHWKLDGISLPSGLSYRFPKN